MPVSGQTSHAEEVHFRNFSAVARAPIRVTLTVADPRLSPAPQPNNETGLCNRISSPYLRSAPPQGGRRASRVQVFFAPPQIVDHFAIEYRVLICEPPPRRGGGEHVESLSFSHLCKSSPQQNSPQSSRNRITNLNHYLRLSRPPPPASESLS